MWRQQSDTAHAQRWPALLSPKTIETTGNRVTYARATTEGLDPLATAAAGTPLAWSPER